MAAKKKQDETPAVDNSFVEVLKQQKAAALAAQKERADRQKQYENQSNVNIWFQKHGTTTFMLMKGLPVELKSLYAKMGSISKRWLVPVVVIQAVDEANEKSDLKTFDNGKYFKKVSWLEMTNTAKESLYTQVTDAILGGDDLGASIQYYFDPEFPDQKIYPFKYTKSGHGTDTTYLVNLFPSAINDAKDGMFMEWIKAASEDGMATPEEMEQWLRNVGPRLDKYHPDIDDDDIKSGAAKAAVVSDNDGTISFTGESEDDFDL